MQNVKPIEYNHVHALIETTISLHPRGFRILLGEDLPPDSEEIYAMLSSQRTPLPLDFKATQKSNHTRAESVVMTADYYNNCVKIAGGWPHINHVSQELKKIDPRLWGVASDHVRLISTNQTRFLSRLRTIADKYGISRNTVIKYRRIFPQVLAVMILIPDAENFNLTL